MPSAALLILVVRCAQMQPPWLSMRMLDGLSSSGCWVFKDNLKCAERDEAKTVMCNLESDVIQGILYSSLQINVAIICCHKSHLDFMYKTITHNDTELDSRLHSTRKVHHISTMMPTRFQPYVIVEPRYGFCCAAIKVIIFCPQHFWTVWQGCTPIQL